MFEAKEWLHSARKLDWNFSYVSCEHVFPAEMSGNPWLPHKEWEDWDEPFKTSYDEYMQMQAGKDDALQTIQDVFGNNHDFNKLDPLWLSTLKLHSATLALAEFAAVIGNLKAARFGRDSAWRISAVFAGLDELRHAQVPLAVVHPLVKWDGQFDWTHKFYHSNNWVAIAARHLCDELLLGSDSIEFAIATHFVFESGFTNLQFIGLSALAHDVEDKLFERMITSIQTDEARHAQIGHVVFKKILAHDRDYAQYLVDKWFWRSYLLFAVVTGFSMDYFTPVEKRQASFKEFVHEWVITHFLRTIESFGLEKPWYWNEFVESLDSYHHKVYASAYTYRATVWFNMGVPGPKEREWLAEKYPNFATDFFPIWDQISKRWEEADLGNDFAVHGTCIIGFCNLCQMVLCGGPTKSNSAKVVQYDGKKYIFCSDVCRWIFEKEPKRYSDHKDVVQRVLAGDAPANVIALIRQYFCLSYENWGKDVMRGDYPWMQRVVKTPN